MPTDHTRCFCGHIYDEHDAGECIVESCGCFHFEAEDVDETMVDLGGGMVVPLTEIMDDLA